jgi:hypothetical protein
MLDPATITAVLAPALPYLLRTGDQLASQAADRLGEHTWNLATRLWERLADAVRGRPAAQEVIQDVAANPQDADARAALAYQVRKLVQEDPELGAALEQLIAQAEHGGVTAAGDRSVATSGGVRDSVFITGDNADVQR